MKKKNILFINYYFPPIGGAGVKRMIKFLKFLPNYGWSPIVLTVKNGNHPVKDATVLKEIGDQISVHRAMTIESIANKLTKKNQNIDAYPKSNFNYSSSFINNFKKQLTKIGYIFRIPDSRILWLPNAVIKGLILYRKEKYKVIFSTGPTFTNLIIGAILKKILKLPLVSDFRDAWIDDPMLPKNNKYFLKINNILEKFVILNSDIVISTNSYVTKSFIKRYRNERKEKFITIYNGYDKDDYNTKEYSNCDRIKKFTIVHTGILYNERTPKYFLMAVNNLLYYNNHLKDNLKVIFVGVCEDFFDGKKIEDYIEEYNLSNVVELIGHVDREKSLEYQMKANLLLAIIGIVPEKSAMTYGIPGKLFDYMATGRDILTISNDGASRNFINQFKIGDIFYHNDIGGISNYLKNKIMKMENDSNFSNKDFSMFDISRQSETLSKHLNELLM